VLVNIHHDSPGEHRRLVVAGTAFLAIIALLIALSIAIYTKAFADVTMVTIKADRAGLQLAKFGDVRVNGALVGQVRSISQDGRQASIQVAINPESARNIPRNVAVQIVPTTLFGQKFISLVRPDHPVGHLEDGAVIPASRVETNVELNRVLARLFPLLRSVRPADLNATLNALATALDGRGEELGRTLDKLDSYLGAIDDHLPTLRKDLVLLAQVADTYHQAAPDLLGVLSNVTVTGRTILDQRKNLDTFFSDLSGLAHTSTQVLQDNGANIIKVSHLSAPLMRLLAVYSPEYPCLLQGAANYQPRLARVFRGNMIRQYFVFNTPQYREYDRRDKPVYGEVGHGPWCLGLPVPPEPIGPQPLKDGTDQDDNPPHSTAPQAGAAAGLFGKNIDSGYAGTPADTEVVNALLAARSGRTADSYGSLGPLMFGPVVRGAGGDA
jgi:phospholipid/cholesterol/gamma-HCH transport system substrate-binding protein